MGGLKRTVVLVGMMGSGKSSVGKRLATRLDVPFRDADTEIESAAGATISEIFETLGEPAFRDGERKVIARLLREAPHVLATGGGAFMDSATRAQIKSDAISIWLRAPVGLLLKRVGRRESRPLLKQGDPRETLERLLRDREPFYAQADVVVESEDGPHAICVDRIMSALTTHGALGAA
jgi:shikimate kinase